MCLQIGYLNWKSFSCMTVTPGSFPDLTFLNWWSPIRLQSTQEPEDIGVDPRMKLVGIHPCSVKVQKFQNLVQLYPLKDQEDRRQGLPVKEVSKIMTP